MRFDFQFTQPFSGCVLCKKQAPEGAVMWQI